MLDDDVAMKRGLRLGKQGENGGLGKTIERFAQLGASFKSSSDFGWQLLHIMQDLFRTRIRLKHFLLSLKANQPANLFRKITGAFG